MGSKNLIPFAVLPFEGSDLRYAFAYSIGLLILVGQVAAGVLQECFSRQEESC